MVKINRMIETPVQPEHIKQIILATTGIDADKINEDLTSDDYSTRKVNIVDSMLQSMEEEMSYKGVNVWGMLNGVTHYTTHKGGTDKGRDVSKVFGSLGEMDKKALDYAISFV